MRLVARTEVKVILEITTHEIEKKGFEFHWDKIRRSYKAEDYDVYSIGSQDNPEIIYIELIAKRLEDEE